MWVVHIDDGNCCLLDGESHCSDVRAVLSCMPVGRAKVFADHEADARSFLWVVEEGKAGRAVHGSCVLVEVGLLYCKYWCSACKAASNQCWAFWWLELLQLYCKL
jgi:hypothetical protein